jgi:hypothetical protein
MKSVTNKYSGEYPSWKKKVKYQNVDQTLLPI